MREDGRQSGHDMRLSAAKAASAVLTWGLHDIFHRPAANFPGKVGMHIDPQLISDLRSRIQKGSVVVVGTNGKTTVTNMLADAFERAESSVICNREGANLASGVATALLHAREADWGVFESDELWLARILPQLKPDYVVLLNLFRDQLDRMGEIDHIQTSIVSALASSPATTLIYNADDPLCQAIACSIDNECVPFGIDGELGIPQNTVADASMCQQCDSLLEYKWRQYGQLGSYLCTRCGFKRANPDYSACDVQLSDAGSTFVLRGPIGHREIRAPFAGAYMVYNVLALHVAAALCGVSFDAADSAVRDFDPKNGRLQPYEIAGHRVLLNLAKNPTGFNQNLKIITQSVGPRAVAFFINDKEADGHDVSWLWDIDFQELAENDEITVFAGGIRAHDMQTRLKYVGINASIVDGAGDFMDKAHSFSPDADCYVIANYTALPSVKTELDNAAGGEPMPIREQHTLASNKAMHPSSITRISEPAPKLTIVHMYPELLNLYGDGGNVTILEKRARMRGIDAEVVRVCHGQRADLVRADIVFIGGGPDREQHLASQDLLAQADELREYVEDGGVLLAICGGYQIIGREWLMGDEEVPGLGLVDITTQRAEGGSHNRLVDNIALDSPLAKMPVVGYENHAGRTFLGAGCMPFGRVMGSHGKGNNDTDGSDGVLYRNVIGTYLHGPLLAKNPEIADCLIENALARRAGKVGAPAPVLAALDDSIEKAANAFMCAKLGIRATG